MSLKLYNVLNRKKQLFKPINDKIAKIYTCGPTVYDRVHIGNFRTYVFTDILRRTLKYNGYKVKQIMNITDVDDKIIKKIENKGKSLKAVTEPYAKLFFDDIKKLNIEKFEHYPRATKHIKEMSALIEALLKKGFAYKAGDGSIYFDISKFKSYGKLSGLNKHQIKSGARVNVDEYSKENANDFVLWKSCSNAPICWKERFGAGRPGWHLECSAMAMKYLGENFDIHTGAVDLIFPHHENEIAQSEAATGKKFVNFWVEGEHLLVNNEKMAKSLGNFYTLKDIEGRGFSPMAFRYLVLTTHYRSKLNFTWEAIEAAQNALENLKQYISESPAADYSKAKSVKKQFLSAINDDLNTPKALSLLWKIVKNKKVRNYAKKGLILEFDKVFGLGLNRIKPPRIPEEIKILIKRREILRGQKNWKEADKMREKIKKGGWIVEDSSEGTKIHSL